MKLKCILRLKTYQTIDKTVHNLIEKERDHEKIILKEENLILKIPPFDYFWKIFFFALHFLLKI